MWHRGSAEAWLRTRARTPSPSYCCGIGMVGGLRLERWAPSRQNAGRHQIGIGGRLTSESAGPAGHAGRGLHRPPKGGLAPRMFLALARRLPLRDGPEDTGRLLDSPARTEPAAGCRACSCAERDGLGQPRRLGMRACRHRGSTGRSCRLFGTDPDEEGDSDRPDGLPVDARRHCSAARAAGLTAAP